MEEKIKKEADLNGGISIKRSLCSVVIDAGMSETNKKKVGTGQREPIQLGPCLGNKINSHRALESTIKGVFFYIKITMKAPMCVSAKLISQQVHRINLSLLSLSL